MSVRGVRWIDIPVAEDARGQLTVIDSRLVGFPIERLFYMHRVPAGVERGGHAHPYTDQVLVAVAGQMSLDVSDGEETQTFVLDDPNRGLFVPRLTWTRLFAFSPGAVIAVLANTIYVPTDVIRDLSTFLARVHEAARA